MPLAFVATCSVLFAGAASAELSPDPKAHAHVAGEAVTLQIDSFQFPDKGMVPVNVAVDDGTAENFIGDAGQFIWLNRFTPDPAEFPFRLEQVSAVFGATGVMVGDAIEIVMYTDTDADGDPGTGAVLVMSCDDVIQFNDGTTFNVYNCLSPVLTGPGDVLIGIINRASFEGGGDFPAGIDTGASMGRSWAASYLVGDVPDNPMVPADEQWDTIDNFGFPGNWVVRGAGTTVVQAVSEIPTQSTLGLMVFVLLMLLAAMSMMWRRSARS
jgi:hypothetical protein